MGLFYVVEFHKDHSVYVVPAIWLFDHNSKCNWPESLKDKVRLNSVIQKGTDPSENPRILWKIYDCLVLLGTDDFKKAQKAAEKALQTSEFELTDAEDGTPTTSNGRVLRTQVRKTVFKVPRCHIDSSPGSSDEEAPADTEFHLPGFEVGSFLKNSESDQSTSLPERNLVEDPSSRTTAERVTVPIQDFQSPAEAELPETTETAKKIERLFNEFRRFRLEFQKFESVAVERLVKLGKELDHVSQTLGRHLISSLRVEELGLPVGISLPLKDGRELSILQRWLDVRDNQIKLSNYLRGIGGSDLKDCVRRILERIFAPELACAVNFIGANGKISFKTYHVRCCLIASLRTDPQSATPTEAEVDRCVQKWFGGSGDRNGGRAARKKPQASAANQEVDELEESE